MSDKSDGTMVEVATAEGLELARVFKDEATAKEYQDYLDLVKEIKQHNENYHVKNAPTISDPEYDKLFRKLLDIEKKHPAWVTSDSPSQLVGTGKMDTSNMEGKGIHPVKMYSLSNIFNDDELRKFLKRFAPLRHEEGTIVDQFYCDCKMDGLAISLLYCNGHLNKALTRGDGRTGEDVTENVRMIPNIPMRVPTKKLLLVRGEVVVHKADFYAANRKQLEAGKEPFKSPRAYATGSLKQKDPQVTKERQLRFYAWELTLVDKTYFPQDVQMGKLVELGFNIPQGKLCYSEQDILSFIHQIDRMKDELLYAIDGVVIKQNTIKYRVDLGWNRHDPLWATAWKFTSLGVPTEIKEIFWSMGRTGKLTPVAVLKPITIGGVRVEMVSCSDASNLEAKQLGPGASVVVIRSGDVIPKISEIVTTGKFQGIPTECPYCHQPTVRVGADLKCINPLCPEILYAKLKYAIGKEVLNIDGLGASFAKEAVTSGTITSMKDIFTPIETKSPNITQDSLDILVAKAREINLAKFFMILGIKNMGKAIAGKLAVEVGDLASFIKLLQDPDALRIMFINEGLKKSLKEWYSVEYNRDLLDYVLKLELPYC